MNDDDHLQPLKTVQRFSRGYGRELERDYKMHGGPDKETIHWGAEFLPSIPAPARHDPCMPA